MPANNVLLLYSLVIAPISIALFLYGFFPIAHHDDTIASQLDIPGYIGNVSVKKDLLYSPMVTRLIIMVIDALRWDFVTGPVGKSAMPVTTSLLANSSGCLLQAKLQSPTVTMPRIKAMMTGMVPNFVDIVLNFGSKPLQSDSLLLQAKKNGHKLVFYGDNTWLSLFPNIFERHDGTTSFFVTDFTEVDNNVTRHIQDELNQDDWNVMILHYLGLDHIGHVEGPFGASIEPKLQEMDNIIAQITQRVQYWNNDGIPALFIVCGDHGMKNSGGHGGSTPQETTVPFIAIGSTHCSQQENGGQIVIEQLDIAATLSAALGLPIPSTNLGSMFLDNIYDLDDAKRLFLLHYNSKLVLDRFRKLAHHESQIKYVYQKYLDTVNLHAAWLNESVNEKSREMVEKIASSYNAILKEMKNALISSVIKYDFHSMVFAVILLCQIVVILFFLRNVAWTAYKRIASFLLVCFFMDLGTYLYGFESSIWFYTTNILNILLFITGILYINCGLCLNNISNLSLTEFKGSKMRGVFQIGMLLHMASFAGSSFIEEEHQTWYFFWASTMTYFLYHCSRKLLTHHRYDLASVKVRTELGPNYGDSRRHICAKLLLLLIGHRVLRKLNSTGDKWAHLPDIASWLKEDDSKVGMTLLLLTALVLLIWIADECEDKAYRRRSLIFNITIAACIYFRHMANGAVMRIPFYFLSRPRTKFGGRRSVRDLVIHVATLEQASRGNGPFRVLLFFLSTTTIANGIYEVHAFWEIIILFLLNCGYRVTLIIKRDKQRLASTMLFFIINIWMMISAMLHQPHNVILLPIQVVASLTIDGALKENDLLDLGVFVHCWLGNVFYFYQGNSNSLASIDIAAGYVGLRSYMPFITGAYLIINTYSAPVLAYFLLVYYRQLNQHRTDIVACTSRTYIAWRLLTITVYMIIIGEQRHHLFVWSVFSPKLLYEAMYSAVMCCSVILALIVIRLQAAVIPNYEL